VELDPWGNVLNEFNPKNIDQPIRMQGQQIDRESGLFYNRHRYYDPQMGRYITQDPIGLEGGNNLYGYVKGNPNGIVDPMGLEPPTANPNGPYYHSYMMKTDICKTEQLGCTKEKVWELLKKNAAPGSNGKDDVRNDVASEIKFLGLSGGKVNHIVDDASKSVYNVTAPGHIFSDGFVKREVTEENGTICVKTTGEGNNKSALKNLLNMKTYKPGFTSLDNNIIKQGGW
jgi:RHS repeat-associated protein